MIYNTLALVAQSIGGTLSEYDDGYVISTYLKKDNSFTARFYYTLEGELDYTTLI